MTATTWLQLEICTTTTSAKCAWPKVIYGQVINQIRNSLLLSSFKTYPFTFGILAKQLGDSSLHFNEHRREEKKGFAAEVKKTLKGFQSLCNKLKTSLSQKVDTCPLNQVILKINSYLENSMLAWCNERLSCIPLKGKE